MHRLLIVSVVGGPDHGPHLGQRHESSPTLARTECTLAEVPATVGAATAPWVCLADGTTRFADDGLTKTLVALGEPSVESAADGLLHHSLFLLFEGTLPRVREVFRLHIGQSVKAPTPTAVLGGAMAQPGALVVRREWLTALPDHERQRLFDGAGATVADVNEALVRLLGARARLLLMPWVLSERVAVRTPGVLDLGDALHLDIRQQVAIGELWRHAWGGADHATIDHVRLLHGLTPPLVPRSLVRRVVGRLRRTLAARRG